MAGADKALKPVKIRLKRPYYVMQCRTGEGALLREI